MTEKKYFAIRYSKLYFSVEFTEDTELVREKSSTLRGGIGEMLLRAHCISDRKCAECGFSAECLVQRTMYSRFKNIPKSMGEGDSVGYIISCSNHKTKFMAGETMDFSITLIGKTIVYFSQYLNAVYALGQNGIGRNKSRFCVVSVKNLYGVPILDGNSVYMENYKWQTVGEYIAYRKKKIGGSIDGVEVCFTTPVTLKYQGAFQTEFSSDAVGRALIRRLSILSAFEELEEEQGIQAEFPQIVEQNIREHEVMRYSSRKEEYMKLKGIEGSFLVQALPEEWLDLLLACEVLHIGKNTSFGFGEYRLRFI